MKRPNLLARWLLTVAVLVTLVFGFTPLAQAHTDFDSSTPANGEVVDQPVSEIKVRFTAASMVAGDGFVVLTPAGELFVPEVVVSEDELEFVLMFDPPLTGGAVGVQWSVRAGDAHPIEGTFSFTTTAETPALSEPEPEPSTGNETAVLSEELTAQDPTADRDNEALDAEDSAAKPSTAPLDPQDEVTESSTAPDEPAAVDAVVEQTPAVPAPEPTAASISMEEFLNADEGNAAARAIGYVGRLASQVGSLVAIGVVAFAVLVSQQRPVESRLFVHVIRRAGLVVIVGAVVEAISLAMSLGISDGLMGSAGLAAGLRGLGAMLLIGVVSRTASSYPGPTAAASTRPLASVGAGLRPGIDGVPPDGSLSEAASSDAGTPSRIERSAVAVASIIAVSFVFDGHTVTKGNRLLTSVVDLIHVAGGAVWVGGLVCLVLLSRISSLRENSTAFADMVLRFSVVASAALAAVGAAGLVLTVIILDSVSELWSTAWGRLLMAKVLIVGVAAVAGAFNHFVLMPAMQSTTSHRGIDSRIVRTMVIEVIALGLAIGLTAFLVAAAS